MRVRLLLGLAMLGLTHPIDAGQAVRIGVRQVAVFATVRDHAGRLIEDLRREDFRLFDNSQPVSIDLFDATPQPLNVLLLIDISASVDGSLAELRDAAAALLMQLSTRDRAKVATFSNTIRIAPGWSDDAQEVMRLLPRSGGAHLTRLYDALVETLKAFDGVEGRRVIVVFTDGADTASAADRHAAIASAREADVMIYAVGVNSRYMEGSRSINRRPDPDLRLVAEETGGGYFEASDRRDLKEQVARISDELRRQYLLGFSPPHADGRVHSLLVLVRRPGAIAHARRSYLAPSERP
jgi:Ca-activated chloride channel homolog